MNSYDPLVDGISKVEYVDHMGSDLSVVNAARVSMNKQSDWAPFDIATTTAVEHPYPTGKLNEGDQKLIKYLAAHNHWTPFGHAQLSLRVKAPIFVARQLVKHQVGLVWNEVSRRYVATTPELYRGQFTSKAESVKQGSTGDNHPESTFFELCRNAIYHQTINLYDRMIEKGVAPEDARSILPLDMYTEWVWSGSLAAWMRVVNLRVDPHSQRHTRLYGNAISKIVEGFFPVSHAALLRGNHE